MSRAHPLKLAAYLAAVIVVFGGMAMIKGAFLVGQHEGDVLHIAQIMLLIGDGMQPHHDFLTPIGFLAFWPMQVLMSAGLPLGKAFFLSQVFVSATLLPAIWWVGISRFSRGAAYVMGGVVLIWVLALVHGEASATTSMSMHYNRWAWAVTALVLFTALLPSLGPERPAVDGAIIGIGMAALGVTKATFAVAFFVPVLVALLAARQFRTVIWAMLLGVAFLVSVTLFKGVEFWPAYVGDLLTVMSSDVRPFPHRPIGNVVAAPEFMGATLLLIASIVTLRKGGQSAAGLAMLLLAPAFLYVTFQNFGNDPKWLPIVGLILFMLAPRGGQGSIFGFDLRQTHVLLAAVAFALNLPSLVNIGSSSWRNRTADISEYAVMVPGIEQLSDVLIPKSKIDTVDVTIAAEFADKGVDHLRGVTERENLTEIAGEMLPQCQVSSGLIAYLAAYAKEAASLGVAAGERVFVADIFSAIWLYGDSAPVKGLSPWYYGGAPGLQSAQYLSVPLCPVRDYVRRQAVEAAFAREDVTLQEVARGPMQILYQVTPAD
ncbi:MAG: hypothetical protein ACWA47_07230 [Brevirhabdus sp.]